jgi:CysZ protein
MKKIMRSAGAVAKSPVGFARGLSFVLRGMRFVYIQHPGLARYWLIPVVITVVALVGVLYGVGSSYDQLADAVWSLFPKSWGEATGWIGGLLTVLHWLIGLVTAVLVVVLGLVAVVVLSSVVAAPFNDALSEAVERIVTGEPALPFSLRQVLVDVGRTIRIEALKVLIYVAVVGPMFIASFLIPGLGQVVSLLGFALTAIYLGIDYVDWPAARRNWSVADRVGFARRQLPAIAGFGTGVWALLFIPVVNLLFMPAAVAGGTILFLSLAPSKEEGSNPSVG